MEQSLKLYTIAGVLLLLCSCRLSGPLSSRSAGPYLYETYAPVKETLLFYDDNRCIYTYYDVLENKKIIDTCLWKLAINNEIIIYKETIDVDSTLKYKGDSIEIAQMNFIYDICPKWNGIKKWEFQKHKAYRSPISQEIPVSYPVGISPKEMAKYKSEWTFEDKYGRYQVVCDTINTLGPVLIWGKKHKHPPFLFATNKQFPKEMDVPDIIKKAAYTYPSTMSYEFLNYKDNQEKKVDFELDSIKGKQFSYIGETCKKESIRFVNDSICAHYLSTRDSVSSPFVQLTGDTCHYSVKNNLIAIDFEKDKPCDTLTYSNGIIFYSKVYKEGDKYTHIVKPFIDETRSCANKADSIDMIMSTYFNVYVPLNMYK